MDASYHLARLLLTDYEHPSRSIEDFAKDFADNKSNILSPLKYPISLHFEPLLTHVKMHGSEDFYYSLLSSSCGLREPDITVWNTLQKDLLDDTSDIQDKTWQDAILLRDAIFEGRINFLKSRIQLFTLALSALMSTMDSSTSRKDTVLQIAKIVLKGEDFLPELLRAVLDGQTFSEECDRGVLQAQINDSAVSIDASRLRDFQMHSIHRKEMQYIEEALLIRQLLLITTVFAARANLDDLNYWTIESIVRFTKVAKECDWRLFEPMFYEETIQDEQFQSMQDHITYYNVLICSWLFATKTRSVTQIQDVLALPDSNFAENLTSRGSSPGATEIVTRCYNKWRRLSSNSKKSNQDLEIALGANNHQAAISFLDRMLQYTSQTVGIMEKGDGLSDVDGIGSCSHRLLSLRYVPIQHLAFLLAFVEVIQIALPLTDSNHERDIEYGWLISVIKIVRPLFGNVHIVGMLFDYSANARADDLPLKNLVDTAAKLIPQNVFPALLIHASLAKGCILSKALRKIYLQRYPFATVKPTDLITQSDQMFSKYVRPTSPFWHIVLDSLDKFEVEMDGHNKFRSVHIETRDVVSYFFELFSHMGSWKDAETSTIEIGALIGHIRLERWWTQHRIPKADIYLPVLFKEDTVSLSKLHDATNQELVDMGISDRYVRDKIMELSASISLPIITEPNMLSCKSFAIDGLYYLLHIALLTLQNCFIDDSLVNSDSLLGINAMRVISVITAIKIFMDSLVPKIGPSGNEHIAACITYCSRSAIEVTESLDERNFMMAAALTTMENMVQWCLATEIGVLNPIDKRTCIAESDLATIEQIWITTTVEFVLECILSCKKWVYTERKTQWIFEATWYRIFSFLLKIQYATTSCRLNELQRSLHEAITGNPGIMNNLVDSAMLLLDKARNKPSQMVNSPLDEPIFQAAILQHSGSKKIVASDKSTILNVKNPSDILHMVTATDLILASMELLRCLYIELPLDGTSGVLDRVRHSVMSLAASYCCSPPNNEEIVTLECIKLLQQVSRSSSEMTSGVMEHEKPIVTAFPSAEDREAISTALASSFHQITPKRSRLRIETIILWSTWLDVDPAFFALIVMPNDKTLERGIITCVQNVLQNVQEYTNSAIQCACLSLCLQLWKMCQDSSSLHLHLMQCFVEYSEKRNVQFWQMLFDIVNQNAKSLQDTSQTSPFLGDATHARLANGLVFSIFLLEWHHRAGSSASHPLRAKYAAIFEQKCYATWTTTPSCRVSESERFLHTMQIILPFCIQMRDISCVEFSPATLQKFSTGILCDESRLRSQLQSYLQLQENASLLERVKWANDAFASAQSQQFFWSKWKDFMVLTFLSSPNIPLNTADSNDDTLSIVHPARQLLERGEMVDFIACIANTMKQFTEASYEDTLDYFAYKRLHSWIELLLAIFHMQSCTNIPTKRNPAEATLADQKLYCRLLDIIIKVLPRLVAFEDEENAKGSLPIAVDGDASSRTVQSWTHLLPVFFGFSPAEKNQVLTAFVLLLQHLISHIVDEHIPATPVITNATKLAEVCLRLIARPVVENSSLGMMSWSLLHQLIEMVSFATNALRADYAATLLAPFIATLEHRQNGFSALLGSIISCFDMEQANPKLVRSEAIDKLQEIVALMCGQTNPEFLHRIFNKSAKVLWWAAINFIPVLRARLMSEVLGGEADTAMVITRRYTQHHLDLEAWCMTLKIATASVRLAYNQGKEDAKIICTFIQSAERLIINALDSTRKLTTALVQEQLCVLRFVSEIMRCKNTLRAWQCKYPKSCILILERSRQLFRLACVLVADHVGVCAIGERWKKDAGKIKTRSTITAFETISYAKRTMLHYCMQPTTCEAEDLIAFYADMERKVFQTIGYCAGIMSLYTMHYQKTEVIINGVPLFDDERCAPLLAWVTPSKASSLRVEPSLGHLCLAVDAALQTLHDPKYEAQTEDAKKLQQGSMIQSINACCLLFLQIQVLYMEFGQSEVEAREEYKAFFAQLVSCAKDTEYALKIDYAVPQQIVARFTNDVTS